MTKTFLILTALLLSLTAFSQTSYYVTKKPLQKLIIDVGVTPFQISLADEGTLKSVNFALGYEITKKIDLRFNVDLNIFIDRNPFGRYAKNEFSYLTGLSLGVNYNLFDHFRFIYDNSAIDILAKFGIDVNDYSEQESFLYDISLRLKMKDLSYIGIGYNQHMFGSMSNSDMKGIYLTLGLEF
jgi:hypothetical protein